MTAAGLPLRARIAEGLLLAAVAGAPWSYGCAPDMWRYGLATLVLFASALWFSACPPADAAARHLRLAALGLPALGVLQIASAASVSPVETAEATLQLLAALGALVAWTEIARERACALRLAAVLVGVAVAQGIFGVVEYALAPGMIYGRALPVAQMPFGSYVNHNHFAGLLEMAAPLALGWAFGLWRHAGGPVPAALALGGAGLGLAAAHLGSRSRGGLLALGVGLASLGLLWWLRHHRRSRQAIAFLVALLVVLAVIGFGWLAVPEETRHHLATVARGSSDASGSYRLDIARATLELAVSRPWLGAGLGAYADAVPRYKPRHGDVRTTHAESDVLQLVAEGGVVAIAACGWLGVLLFERARRRIAERDDPVRRGVALGAAAGALALLAHSWMDFNLHLPANALFFVALVGLATALPFKRGLEPAAPKRRCGAGALVLVLLFALGGIACAWRAWGAGSLDLARLQVAPRARIVTLSAVLARHPYLTEAYRDRARARMALVASGSTTVRWELIERDLSRVVGRRPLWGEAWADLGWVLWAKGDWARAGAALQRARALDPQHRGIVALAEKFERAQSDRALLAPSTNLK